MGKPISNSLLEKDSRTHLSESSVPACFTGPNQAGWSKTHKSFTNWPVLQQQAFPTHFSPPAQGQCLATRKGQASPTPQAVHPVTRYTLLPPFVMSAVLLTDSYSFFNVHPCVTLQLVGGSVPACVN